MCALQCTLEVTPMRMTCSVTGAYIKFTKGSRIKNNSSNLFFVHFSNSSISKHESPES